MGNLYKRYETERQPLSDGRIRSSDRRTIEFGVKSMPITRLTRLELEGIYEADTVLRLLDGSRWVLPEKLPVPTGTTVSVHLEVVTPEGHVSRAGKGWYERAAALRQAIHQRRGETAGSSVDDLHAVREARAENVR